MIPNFSYLSEVGASFLDDRLGLNLVPKTRLVGLVSTSFHYLYKDRKNWERFNKPLPIKVGSLQQFLDGYENASRFFQRYTLPGRPKALMERDLTEEQEAHRLSRRKQGARLRLCFIALKRLLLCRYGPGPYGSDEPLDEEANPPHYPTETATYPRSEMRLPGPAFQWTEETFRDLRLELEKLILLDILMRNTDRGLDNFMIKYNPSPAAGERRITIGAIDNSLSFPHQNPQGLRDYPFGWLYLPAALIGQPFSEETRRLFLPKLTDPIWWANTIEGLRRIFSQDIHFNERIFQNQMDLLRGQGWNIVQSLQAPHDGPIELCARQKFMVRSTVQTMSNTELSKHTVVDLVQGSISFSNSDKRSISTNHTYAIPQATSILSDKLSVSGSMGQLASSMPTPSILSRKASWEREHDRAIDIVERMEKATRMDVDKTRGDEARMDPRDLKPSQRVQPLDLAVTSNGLTHSTPVLVESLEPVTRRAWLSSY